MEPQKRIGRTTATGATGTTARAWCPGSGQYLGGQILLESEGDKWYQKARGTNGIGKLRVSNDTRKLGGTNGTRNLKQMISSTKITLKAKSDAS